MKLYFFAIVLFTFTFLPNSLAQNINGDWKVFTGDIFRRFHTLEINDTSIVWDKLSVLRDNRAHRKDSIFLKEKIITGLFRERGQRYSLNYNLKNDTLFLKGEGISFYGLRVNKKQQSIETGLFCQTGLKIKLPVITDTSNLFFLEKQPKYTVRIFIESFSKENKEKVPQIYNEDKFSDMPNAFNYGKNYIFKWKYFGDKIILYLDKDFTIRDLYRFLIECKRMDTTLKDIYLAFLYKDKVTSNSKVVYKHFTFKLLLNRYDEYFKLWKESFFKSEYGNFYGKGLADYFGEANLYYQWKETIQDWSNNSFILQPNIPNIIEEVPIEEVIIEDEPIVIPAYILYESKSIRILKERQKNGNK